MFLISNVLTQRAKYHYTEECRWTNGKKKNAQIQRCSYERLGNAQSWSSLWSCTVASTSVYPCTWFGWLPVLINYRWNPSRRNHRPPQQCDPVRLPYETLPRISCACKCISLLVRCMDVFGFRIRILHKKTIPLAPWSSNCCQFSNVLLLKKKKKRQNPCVALSPFGDSHIRSHCWLK